MNPSDPEVLGNRIVADPELLRVRPLIEERCAALAELLAGPGFPGLAPRLLPRLLRDGFSAIPADEGTLWLADPRQEHLLPVLNTGPRADELVGSFRQPLDRGLVSMVYSSEQPFCEDQVYRNELQDDRVDRMLGMLTCSMMIAPLVFAGRTRGVLSCVRLKPADDGATPDPGGFGIEEFTSFNCLAEVVGALVDAHLVKLSFGVE